MYKLPESNRYTSFNLKKRGGGERQILAPHKNIRDLQEKLKVGLESLYKPGPSVFGYVEGKDIKRNAQRHKNSRYVARVDLENFFPSINFGRVLWVLKTKPFSFSHEVAVRIAQICTYDGYLPQGAPTSPIFSNIVCKGLDFKLRRFAIKHKCQYTRYADDLVFSTSKPSFPIDIVLPSQDNKFIVGEELKKLIESSGFYVNNSKTQLMYRANRQMVSGLVVNKKVSPKREYIRSTRAILHNWALNKEKAEDDFFKKYDFKNRSGDDVSFEDVIIGRVQYIGYIRGWDDPTYINLAKKLEKLSSRFRTNINRSYEKKSRTIHLYTEGVSDQRYIEAALDSFRKSNKYQDLNIEFHFPLKDKSESALFEHLEKRRLEEKINRIEVCLFDADSPKYLEKIGHKAGTFKRHNQMYSLVIPRPSHILEGKPFSIERLFLDNDLTAFDEYGRRIYLNEEFDDDGVHRLELDKRLKKKTKRKENAVFDHSVILATDTGDFKSVALGKIRFANLVKGSSGNFNDIDFGNFEPLFGLMTEIIHDFLGHEYKVSDSL